MVDGFSRLDPDAHDDAPRRRRSTTLDDDDDDERCASGAAGELTEHAAGSFVHARSE
jgi:hypothetical protein